jgi:hypothetical protein
MNFSLFPYYIVKKSLETEKKNLLSDSGFDIMLNACEAREGADL